jgi:hypothetical protein
LLASVWKSTHLPLQQLPGRQQTPPQQIWPALHLWPQAFTGWPQLFGSLNGKIHTPLQQIWSKGQQVPLQHGLKGSQSAPQLPQCS